MADLAEESEVTQPQLLELETSLRKKENALRSKIDAEKKELEKLALRRDFYKQLQGNIKSKNGEALANLNSAESALGAVREEVKVFEGQQEKLQSELANVIAQNESEVLPELDRLRLLLQTSKNEVLSSKRACDVDSSRIVELSKLIETYEAESEDTRRVIDETKMSIAAMPQPESFEEELSVIEVNAQAIKREIDELEAKKKQIATQTTLQNQRQDELEKLKAADEVTLNEELAKVQKQRQEYNDNVKSLGEQRVTQHSLASSRVELELNTAVELDSIKHNTNFLSSVDRRSLNVAKQSLSKREAAAVKIKESIPAMKVKLTDLQCQLATTQTEQTSLEREQSQLQIKLDQAMTNLLQQEDLDETRQANIEDAINLVANQELEMERMRADEKRAGVILGIKKEQSGAVRRKIEEAQQMKHDLEGSVRLQQLIEIDLTKKNLDMSNKCKELKLLCSMIEDEKMETNMTIRKLNESLVALKRKLDELKVELRTLVLERDDKMNIRRLLRKDIEASSQCRAANRRDKMINWTSCRVITEEIANEESRMDKLKATLSLTRREVHRMEAQNEKVLQTKKSLLEQLAAKKALLFSLFDKNNIYAETLKKGEAICQQLEEEKKTVELKNNDIKRSIAIIKADLQDQTNIEARIESAKKNLELQILETERISTALEEPNQDKFRMLDGHDPSNEELEQNLAALESLERNNREMLRTRAIALKELGKHTHELQEELANWKESSGPYLKDINDLQGRLHELQRVRTSQLSEIQMYASLIDKLTSSKAGLEHDVSFRATLTSKPEREAPTFDAASPKKRTMEQRPTAYMPTGPDDEIIKVPRPFGKMAPFKAIEPGSTMRHIRKPQPVPLLLPN